jgi:predicted TIM-barrel fold metal-dependent hydrolase
MTRYQDPAPRPPESSVVRANGRRAAWTAAVAAIPLLAGFPAHGQAEPGRPALTPDFAEIEKIDVHSHVFDDIPYLVAMLRRDNVRVVNIANRGTDGNLDIMHRIAEELRDKYPDRLAFASTFDLTRVHEPGYSDEVVAWLDRTFASGAVMTKIWKEIGLDVKTPAGEFLMPDDPIFDPIYAHLAERGKPLLAHIAEPLDAWLPLDPESVHYTYYSRNPEWHLYQRPEFPTHAELIAARDRIMEKHPDLVVIGAHLGSLEHDVDEVARRLDRYPNFHVEVSARTRDLSRQPTEKVREFFIRYSDRIMYGLDATFRPFLTGPVTDEQRIAFADDLMRRYRLDYEFYASTDSLEFAGRRVVGLGLPAEVLRKFYAHNALRLIPGLSETPHGWHSASAGADRPAGIPGA